MDDRLKSAALAARGAADAFVQQSIRTCKGIDKLREGFRIALPEVALVCRAEYASAIPYLRAQRDALQKLIEILEAKPS